MDRDKLFAAASSLQGRAELESVTAECRPHADSQSLFGVPLVDMSRDEMLAVIVFLKDRCGLR